MGSEASVASCGRDLPSPSEDVASSYDSGMWNVSNRFSLNDTNFSRFRSMHSCRLFDEDSVGSSLRPATIPSSKSGPEGCGFFFGHAAKNVRSACWWASLQRRGARKEDATWDLFLFL